LVLFPETFLTVFNHFSYFCRQTFLWEDKEHLNRVKSTWLTSVWPKFTLIRMVTCYHRGEGPILEAQSHMLASVRTLSLTSVARTIYGASSSFFLNF